MGKREGAKGSGDVEKRRKGEGSLEGGWGVIFEEELRTNTNETIQKESLSMLSLISLKKNPHQVLSLCNFIFFTYS